MAHSYKSLIEAGGCRVAYLWNVSGYPWGVCSDTAIVSLLDRPDVYYDAAYARRRIFGNVEIGLNVPAYDALVFDTLHPELGTQTTKAGALGFCDVSGWSLKILDKHLGAVWPHISEGDEVWGIEGVHRVADLNDEIHGWGFIDGNVSPDATVLPIHEESADSGSGPLYDRIDAEADYKCVWIGHECIAVKNVSSGSYPDYNATIVGRGLFRSKKQFHFTDSIEQVHQIISDVPQSIVGHYCWLWAIPLTPDGEFYRDADDNPIIALESARCGVVSESVVTDKGVTQIKIRPWTSALENKIEYDTTENITGHIGKYVFCRGDSGSTWQDILEKRQKPHLIFLEYVMNEGADSDLNPGNWIPQPLWLCARNSSVTFNSLEELVEAVNAEMFQLSLYHVSDGAFGHSQLTGEGTAECPYVGLHHEYHVVKNYEFTYQYYPDIPVGETILDDSKQYITFKGTLDQNPMWYLKQSSGGPTDVPQWLQDMIDAGTASTPWAGKWTMVGGVVQLCLGLGIPHLTGDFKLPVSYRSQSNYDLEFWDFSKFTLNPLAPWGLGDFQIYRPGVDDYSWQFECNPAWYLPHESMVFAGLCQRPEILQFKAPENFFCANSFHGWDWVNHPYSEFAGGPFDPVAKFAAKDSGKISTGGKLYLSEDPTYEDLTIWTENTDGEQFVSGAIVKIGKFQTEVSELHEEDTGVYLETTNDSDNPHLLESNDDVFFGECLITIPAYSLPSDSDNEDILDPEKIAEEYDENNDDPFRIKLFREEYADKITDVVKAFIGYDDTGIWIPQHERRLFIPFIRDDSEDGMVSFIDWDSFESMCDGHLAAFKPVVPHESFVLKTEIDQILKLNGVGMEEYWDSTRSMFRYRFRKYGNMVSSLAIMSGRVIGLSDLVSGESVAEDHLLQAIYNKISLAIVTEQSFKKYDDKNKDIEFVNADVHSVIDREIMDLKISPKLVVYRDPLTVNQWYATFCRNHFVNLLYRLGDKKPTQTRGLLYSSRFRSQPGGDSIITDPFARNPNTHRAGLVSANILITEQKVDLTNNTLEVSFLVAGNSAVHGYAPSCRVLVGSVTVNEDGFTCVPDDHYGCEDVKDIFFFDCFDISDRENPVPRSDSCGNYAVRVYAQDEAISSDNPITGTCMVFDDSGTWKLRVYCDESKLPSTGYLIITYDTFDNCEPDQKAWMFFSDSNGRVGSAERKGDVWG